MSTSDCRWHNGRCAYRDDDPTRCPFCHLSWEVVQRDGVHHCERPQAWRSKRDVRRSIARQMREAVEQGHDPLAVLEAVEHAGRSTFCIDLTGQRFGRLTVVERVDRPGTKKTWWRCRCACGGTSVVWAASLQSGDTKSCGCLHLQVLAKGRRARLIDLTGQVFGKLTVVKRSSSTVVSRPVWLCRCECGGERVVQGSHLSRGTAQSCGCLNQEHLARTNSARLMDLTGQVFGSLTVIERAEDSVSKAGNRSPRWLCRCQCGTEKVFQGSHLRSGNTTSCGCVSRLIAQPTYIGAHARIRRTRGPASAQPCAHGGDHPAQDWAYNHLDPHELTELNPKTGAVLRYSADPAFYVALCKSHHRKFDQA